MAAPATPGEFAMLAAWLARIHSWDFKCDGVRDVLSKLAKA